LTILLATDGSESAEAATEVALDLARTTGDDLIVVTVWRELRGDFGVPLASLFPDVAEIEHSHAREVAERVAAEAAVLGIDTEAVVRHGDAPREICAVARERKPRMIVVGSEGWGMVGRTVFGSVSESVLRHAGCPVLVVPSPEARERRQGAPAE